MHAKHRIWGKETIFPEVYLLTVFERVRQQNAKKKKNENQPKKENQKRVFCVLFITLKKIMEKQYRFTKYVYFQCFDFLT